MNQKNWYQKSIEEAILTSDSDLNGISQEEASKRLNLHGKNELKSGKKKSAIHIFIEQFTNLLTLVLIAASIISYFIGDSTDTFVILAIVFLNSILGFTQEYRAEKSMEALQNLSSPMAHIKRRGVEIVVPSFEIVPGDIVLLDQGMMVPADLRILGANNLQIDESSLTGESTSVSKQTHALDQEKIPIADQINMAFKGSLVVAGRGTGVVVATGSKTQLGNIAHLLTREIETNTPLQIRLATLSKQLTVVTIIICVFLIFIGLWRDESLATVFMTSLSLAVAAIPEALPAVLTITLALGAARMSKKNALIRKLSAVETLGSVTLICSDKTGTLTLNNMQVRSLYLDTHEIKLLDKNIPSHRLCLQLLAQNLDAYQSPNGEYIGDPTETALLQFAVTNGFSREEQDKNSPRVAEIPFSSERKLMTTVHRVNDGHIVWVKGAPENILSRCHSIQVADRIKTNLDLNQIKNELENMASAGQRVLALAYKKIPSHCPLILDEIENDLIFLGAVGLIDPPRPEVYESIKQCHEAGLKVVMITGDHPKTASAIAKEIGILNHNSPYSVISGTQLTQMSDADLLKNLSEVRVFARVAPEQKINLVKAYQGQGQVVAMTGDGVNDAPALRKAQVGIAMGKNGTDVAREAAPIILLDDNFSSIVSAIKEGRRIYDNIRKFIRYALSGNSGEIWTLLLAPFALLPTPLLPIHILWINLVTDGLPGITLALEKEEKDIMQRPPRPPHEGLFSRGLGVHCIWVGILSALITLGVMAWAIYNKSPNWQTMSFSTLCFVQLMHILSIRSENQSFLKTPLSDNYPLTFTVIGTFVLQILVIYLPIFNQFLKTSPLTFLELLICILASTIILIAVEIEKKYRRTHED